MDFGNLGSEGAQKKGSIFEGLNLLPKLKRALPVPPPTRITAPQPVRAAAPPPALAPAADSESVAVLKQKIDALEKNIAVQLEKKIAEQFKAISSAPPPPSVSGGRPAAPCPPDALLLKISELERRLGEFSQQAGFSASQMRNIEESKISARREIEELLKAVREQQKYSEIDRQMHSQLEKSWVRVEELEKKLMDFYASVLVLETHRKEDLAAERGRDQSSFGEIKDMLVSLARRLEAFERAAASAPAITAQDLRRELEAGLAASSTTLRSVFADYAAGEMARIGQKFNIELETLRREGASQAAALKDALAGFSSAARENRIKTDGVETALGAIAEKLQGRFEALAVSMLAGLKKENDERFEKFGGKYEGALVEALAAAMMNGLKKDNDEKFNKFSEKYAHALTSLSFLETFQAAAGGAAEKLAYFERIISAFVKSADRGELSGALGVSGMLRRGIFDDMEASLGQFKAEREKIENIRASLSSRFKDVFKGH